MPLFLALSRASQAAARLCGRRRATHLDHDIRIPLWFCSLQRRRHAARFDSSVIRLCGSGMRAHTRIVPGFVAAPLGPLCGRTNLAQSLHTDPTHAGRLCSSKPAISWLPGLSFPGSRPRGTAWERIVYAIPTFKEYEDGHGTPPFRLVYRSHIVICHGTWTLTLKFDIELWTLSASTGPSGSWLGGFH